MNLRRTLTKGTFKELYPQAIEIYRVDYSIYKLMNVKIQEGRGLNNDDFSYDSNIPIPMIVSSIYKGIINIDDILRSRLDNKDYKVVGFFNENLYWLDKNNPILNKLVPLNDKIITPYIIDTSSGLDTVIKSQAYYVINNDKMSGSHLKNEINGLGKQFNLNIEAKSLDDQLSDVTNKNKESIFFGLLISIFIVIISCFSLTIIMYYSVNIRKRELGIRIMCGGSIKYIKSLIIGEILLLMSFSLLISFLILTIFKKTVSVSSNVINFFDIKTIILIFIFIILFTIISSLLPLFKISKLSPKELIGGVD